MANDSQLDFRNFLGVFNSCDPTRIPQTKGGVFLEVGQNVDIDDEKMLHRRKGYERVLPGNVHSLWSNGKICLYCQGTELKRLFEDYSQETLLTGVTERERMNFVDLAGVVYMSNRSIVGFIENGKPYPFPNPNMKFKKRMVGGHLIEIYNSRLYSAQNNKIFFSDATMLQRFDTRYAFMQFEGWITMLKAVTDGLYVGAGDYVYFLAGDDPFSFILTRITDDKAIEGSAIVVEGEDVAPGIMGKVVIWASETDVYMGVSQGQVKALTDGRFTLTSPERGTAIYKWDRGYGQYLMVYEMEEGKEPADLKLEMKAPSVTMQGTQTS